MKDNSTPIIPLSPSPVNKTARCERGCDELAPRRQTIELLRQFARAYSCVATLPPAIGAIVAN